MFVFTLSIHIWPLVKFLDVLKAHNDWPHLICFNSLDAGIRSTDFAQTPYAAGSLLTDGTVYERSGW